MKVPVALLLVTACGRIGFDPRSDATGALDAPGDFGPPMIVGELSSTETDDDPTLTGDGLELYFVSLRAGGAGMADIWRTVRNSVDEPWQPPQAAIELNTASNDESPGITADGLELYFTSDRGGGNDIWTSTRTTRADPWLAPTLVTELSTGAGDFQPQPAPSRVRLVLYRTSGDRDIYESTRAAVGMQWQSASTLAGINSLAGDRSPCLDGSGLTIVFSSDRDSSMVDVQDIYLATRNSLAEPFAAPQPLAAINSLSDEDGAWLSPDGSVLYFASDRSGNVEIYRAHR